MTTQLSIVEGSVVNVEPETSQPCLPSAFQPPPHLVHSPLPTHSQVEAAQGRSGARSSRAPPSDV